MRRLRKIIPDKDSVWVESRTYKGHWRAKRGSVKEAKLNAAMQKSTEDLKLANVAAQLIKSQLDPFRQNFMGGLFWHQLVKKFKEQLKNGEKFNTSNFKDVEVWELYPLSRFGVYYQYGIEISSKELTLTIRPNKQPDFRRTFTDSYRMSVLAIYPDFDKMEAYSETYMFETIYLKNAVEYLQCVFPVPAGVLHYLLIIKVEGTKNGEIDENVTIKGMRVISGGNLNG